MSDAGRPPNSIAGHLTRQSVNGYPVTYPQLDHPLAHPYRSPAPIRRASQIAAIAGLVFLVAPTSLTNGYPTFLTNTIALFDYVTIYPQLVASLALSLAQLILVTAVVVLAIRWLRYESGAPGAHLRKTIGLVTVFVTAGGAILSVAAGFAVFNAVSIPIASLAGLLAGVALTRAGLLAKAR
jgi:hypothetical protein